MLVETATSDRMVDVNNEYKYNKRFREYVERYSKHMEISIEDALKHEIVRQTCLYYTEV